MSLASLLAAVIGAAAFALSVGLPPRDTDLFWHLASARWMVEHGELMTRDPFSHTVQGAPFNVGEWLGQLAWYAAYAADGWAGIAALRAGLVAAAAFFAVRTALLLQPRPAVAVWPALAALFVAAQTIVWSDRPQLFTYALASAYLFLLFRARLGQGVRALALLPPLQLAWTNLHGGYPLGLALVAVFFLAALVERAPTRAALATVLGACAVAALANPAALGPFAAAGHVTSPPRFIEEELPPDVFRPAGFVFAALLVASLASAVVAGWQGPLWPLLLLPLAWLGLSAQRHLAVAALAFAPFLALAAPAALERVWPRLRLGAPPRAQARPVLAAALVVALAGAAAQAASAAPAAPDESAYPRAALEPLRATQGNLLNEYDWGGYLIWNAPTRPVFIDGRLFVFLPDVLADFQEAASLGPRFREVLDRRRVDVVLLRPARPLAVFLRETGWRVRAEEPGRFVLMERP